MIRFPQVFTVLCVSIFLSNKVAYCKNVADVVVKNERDFPTTTVVGGERTVEWHEGQTWNPTQDCNSKSNDGKTMILKNVVKRLVNPTISTTRPANSVKKIGSAFDIGNAKTTEPKSNKTLTTVDIKIDFKSKYPTKVWRDYGFYTDDYMKLINDHWFKFMPPRPTSHYILGFLYVIIMVFGCFGNFLVIFMYIKCKSLQTPANVLVMNLAVSDFFMLAKTPIFIYNSYFQGPALGKIGCQIYGFVGGLTGTVSIMTLTAIAIDRYYVIVHPFKATVKATKHRARVWICIIWTYGFMFSVVPVLDLGLNRYVPEGYLTSCSFDYLTDDLQEKLFILIFFAAAWCVPFIIILYCYTKILSVVWMTSNTVAASRYGQEEEKRKTDIRLGYVVVCIIMLWFVSWTPYAVVTLLGVFDQKEYITPLVSMVPALFCKAASSMDPWIYAITHPRFKVELSQLLSTKRPRSHSRNAVRKEGGGCRRSYSMLRSDQSSGNTQNCPSTRDKNTEELDLTCGV